MALIKCPECGKTVSNSANSCPNCGFGIKKHIEEIARQRAERKEKEEQEKIDRELMKNISLPPKPKKPLLFADSDRKYINALKMYELSQKDPDAYRKRILEAQRVVANAEAQKWLNRPKCPQCGSDNIEKISTTSRAISVATVGLASNKIGKQYKCKKCKHMW